MEDGGVGICRIVSGLLCNWFALILCVGKEDDVVTWQVWFVLSVRKGYEVVM